MDTIALLSDGADIVDRALDEPTRLDTVKRIIARQWPSTEIQGMLVSLAAELDAPFSAVTLLDGSEQHYLVTNGGPMESCSRDMSYCQYVIATGEFLAVSDAARQNPWKRLHRLPIGRKPLQSYLGSPLRVDGQVLGATCVIDVRPRTWTSDEQYEVYRVGRKVAETLESGLRLQPGPQAPTQQG